MQPDGECGDRAGLVLAKRNLLIVVAHPHACGELRRKADVPRVGEIVGGPGFAAGGAAKRERGLPSAHVHDVFEHGDHGARDGRIDHVVHRRPILLK